MKITKWYTNKDVPFKNVNGGDAFIYEGDVYMKLKAIISDASGIDAVDLASGEIVKFSDDDEVLPIDISLPIEVELCYRPKG